MRRIIYGLLMLGGLAFVAAPAHAAFDLQLRSAATAMRSR